MDNPKKPWKAIAAALVTALTAIVGADMFSPEVNAVIMAGVALLTVFFIPNPKVTDEGTPGSPEADGPLF